MLDLLRDSSGEWLKLEAYLADYETRFAAADGHGTWKLERIQHFRSPEEPSWAAFAKGNWDESLRLMEVEREGLENLARESAARGIHLHRVRIVEEPIIPYLQWELYWLRMDEECGARIKVVSAERVKQYEQDEPLPELLVVGATTVYRTVYSDAGQAEGAFRYTGADIVKRSVEFIRDLYRDGEEMGAFFARKVAHLPPPRGE